MTGIGLAVGLSVLGAGWSVQFAALGTDPRLKTRYYAGASSLLELQFLEEVYEHPESERRTLLGTLGSLTHRAFWFANAIPNRQYHFLRGRRHLRCGKLRNYRPKNDV